ncbi:MAG: TIGR04222 domain-containing membrane protein, partial [Pseudomarimonas sp.]
MTSPSNAAQWNAEQTALWQRIQAHPFENATVALDFTRRLAREQHWSLSEARAAVAEYRKFCFLAALGHAVTPSVDVDEVWHLHLTYSRDYWQCFCAQVLRTHLHHGPTVGGLAADARYRDQYGATLRLYEQYFDVPPVRWWPARVARFADAGGFQRVDTRRHWIVRKPRMPAVSRQLALVFGGGMVVLPLLATALPSSPLDWSAEAFLQLFVALSVVAIGIAWITRRQGRDIAAPVLTPEPSVWELAYLSGGPERVADAAVTQLLAQNAARWDGASGRLHPTLAQAELDPPSLAALRCLKADSKLDVAFPRITRAQTPLREALIRRRLWLDDDAAVRLAWISAAAPLCVAAFGALRIALAIGRDRPFVFLLILTVVMTMIGLTFAFKLPGRSRAADRYLRLAKSRHSVAVRAPRNDQLALAVALG